MCYCYHKCFQCLKWYLQSPLGSLLPWLLLIIWSKNTMGRQVDFLKTFETGHTSTALSKFFNFTSLIVTSQLQTFLLEYRVVIGNFTRVWFTNNDWEILMYISSSLCYLVLIFPSDKIESSVHCTVSLSKELILVCNIMLKIRLFNLHTVHKV